MRRSGVWAAAAVVGCGVGLCVNAGHEYGMSGANLRGDCWNARGVASVRGDRIRRGASAAAHREVPARRDNRQDQDGPVVPSVGRPKRRHDPRRRLGINLGRRAPVQEDVHAARLDVGQSTPAARHHVLVDRRYRDAQGAAMCRSSRRRRAKPRAASRRDLYHEPRRPGSPPSPRSSPATPHVRPTTARSSPPCSSR